MFNKILLLLLVFFSFAFNSYAEILQLNIATLEEIDDQHKFFHELLESALKEAGHHVVLIVNKLPQLRIKQYMRDGELSIYWMIESDSRNEEFIPIKVGLTNGLIGKRVLFIPPDNQYLYNSIKNLDDFRKAKFVGAMGKDWFDVNVWKANNLIYLEEPGNWRSIFRKLPHGRPYQYFSRGINEIISESELYPELLIEKNLVLIYDRDFLFYLSKEGPHAGAKYEAIINDAMQKAKKSGLIDRLVDKYWGDSFKALNYDKRIKIRLETPA